MDTVGLMLAEGLAQSGAVEVERIAPAMRRFTPNITANRLLLRFVDYPRWLKRNSCRFDLFHIVDHSYSQLAHSLPSGRTVITCHDIDTFRCVLRPEQDPRGPLFRAMTRRILLGFQKAAHVLCDSAATLADLADTGAMSPNRMSVVPLGAHPSCSPDPEPRADAEAERLLGPQSVHDRDLLHVGSTIERKRIDDLLRIVALVRRTEPDVRLIRVGGPLTPAQVKLARKLEIEPAIVQLPFLTREVLSAVYRRAALVLQPSSAEGFGLPVAEAMTCGTPVLASQLPVLQEVGGDAALYCPPGDLEQWVAATIRLLALRRNEPDRWQEMQQHAVQQGSGFSWRNHATRVLGVYNKVLSSSQS